MDSENAWYTESCDRKPVEVTVMSDGHLQKQARTKKNQQKSIQG